MGDYPAAKRALLEFEKGLPGPPENLPLQRRYNQVRGQLERIHVLARAGDLDEARKRLDALWPEVEAVFAVRPEEVFTQVQMARALWVKAEVADGLDAAARRALLERAIGYMRTWAAAGKLTRFDREVVLAGMEKQMETLRGAN